MANFTVDRSLETSFGEHAFLDVDAGVQNSDTAEPAGSSPSEDELLISSHAAKDVVDLYDYSQCHTDKDKALQDQRNFRHLGLCKKKAHHRGDEFREITFDDEGNMYYTKDRGVDGVDSWKRATFHHWIRKELYELGSRIGTYTHPHADSGPSNATSFLYSQRNWAPTTVTYQPLLFADIPHPHPGYLIQHWYYHGCLVIDYWKDPVKAIIDLPATLSSEIEGHFLEAMIRSDSRIVWQDFRALMPPFIPEKKTTTNQRRPLFDENTYSNRARHFRDNNIIKPLKPRQGSKALGDFKDKCIRENTGGTITHAPPQASRDQKKELKRINIGKFPNRAKANVPIERKARYRKMTMEAYAEQEAARNKAESGVKEKTEDRAMPRKRKARRKDNEAEEKTDEISETSNEHSESEDASGAKRLRTNVALFGLHTVVSNIPRPETILNPWQVNGGAVKPQRRKPKLDLRTSSTATSPYARSSARAYQPLTSSNLAQFNDLAQDPATSDLGNFNALAQDFNLGIFNDLAQDFNPGNFNDLAQDPATSNLAQLNDLTHDPATSINDPVTASAEPTPEEVEKLCYVKRNGTFSQFTFDEAARITDPNVIDWNDSRNTYSRGSIDSAELTNSLLETMKELIRIIGQDCTTPMGLNYCTRWQALQNELWEYIPFAPLLPFRTRWTGGIDKWEAGRLHWDTSRDDPQNEIAETPGNDSQDEIAETTGNDSEDEIPE